MRQTQSEHDSILFSKMLSAGNLPGVILLTGREHYLVRWATKEIEKKYINQTSAFFDYVVIDGAQSDTQAITDACETPPMFSEKKVVIVENFNAESADDKAVADYIAKLPEYAELVFTAEPEKEPKNIAKAVKKHGKVFDFDKISRKMLASFIKKRIRMHRQNIDSAVISLMIDRSGYFDRDSDYTLDSFVADIDKASALCESDISSEAVMKSVEGNIDHDIFRLTDAISEGNIREALYVAGNIIDRGTSPFVLLSMICTQFELILTVMEMNSDGMSLSNIKSELKIHEFRIKKALGYSRRFTPERLHSILMKAYNADSDIKSGYMDERTAIELFIAGL